MLGKFQTLWSDVTLTGTVIWTDGGSIFDLQLDSCFWRLINAFPLFVGVVHCETYGHDGLPDGTGNPSSLVVIGNRISVQGALVLDNYVHADEQDSNPERVIRRGLYRAFRPKLELHPYNPSSVVMAPPYKSTLREIMIPYYAEVYSPDWFWNKLFGKAGYGVGKPSVSTFDVG